jgi:hypothetical protein
MAWITDLKDAIISHGTDFIAGLPGELWYGNITPECASQAGGAYALFNFVDLEQDRTFTENNWRGVIQFRIFDDDSANVDDLLADCIGQYDNLAINPQNIDGKFSMNSQGEPTIPAIPSNKTRFRKFEGMTQFRFMFTLGCST